MDLSNLRIYVKVGNIISFTIAGMAIMLSVSTLYYPCLFSVKSVADSEGDQTNTSAIVKIITGC